MEQRKPCEHDCNEEIQSIEHGLPKCNTEDEVKVKLPTGIQQNETVKECKPSSSSPSISSDFEGKLGQDIKSSSDELQETGVASQKEDKEAEDTDKPAKPKALQRISSSTVPELITLPKVNCSEKIIFCVDHSSTMFTTQFKRNIQSIKQASVFHFLTGALKQFILTKSFINKKHEFSLFLLGEEAQLISDFNNQGSEVLYMLQDISNNSQSTSETKADAPEKGQSFDLSSLFNLIDKHVDLPTPNQSSMVPPPYVVRVIMVYGRSKGTLNFFNDQESFRKLTQNPYFFIDCLYIHEEPDESNDVTETFSRLCELDNNGSSYVLEVGIDGSMSALFNAFAKLTGHPLQRTRQASNLTWDLLN